MLDVKKIQSTNTVTIIGTLHELDITENRTADGRDYVTGKISIKVDQEIGGKMVENIIPVRNFAMRLKNDGTNNPNYDNIVKMKEGYVSLGAAETPSQASRVVIAKGRLEENTWIDKATGEPRTTFQITSNFMRKAKPEEDTDMARFELGGVVGSIKEEVNKEGEETGRLAIKMLPVGWNGKIEMIDMIVENPTAVSYIQSHWEKEDTVTLAGVINMSYKVESWTEEVGFGEPIKRQKTTSRKELVITSGSPSCLDEEFCYDIDGIKAGLAERAANIEALKEKSKKAAAPKPTSVGFGF